MMSFSGYCPCGSLVAVFLLYRLFLTVSYWFKSLSLPLCLSGSLFNALLLQLLFSCPSFSACSRELETLFLCVLFFFFSFLFLSFPLSLPSWVSTVDSQVLLKATVGLLPQSSRSAPKPEMIFTIHTSEHAAGADTGLPGVFQLIILSSSHLPPLCFGLAHPAPNFRALSAEEQIESNLSAQPPASAAPPWIPAQAAQSQPHLSCLYHSSH